MDKERFILELKKLNIDINAKQLEQLDKYYRLLIEWNEKINLTRITEENDVYLKHFFDSITLCKVINLHNLSLCDIGSGAGFPGIVLKIVFPTLSVTLVDALLKRVNFLNEVIKELGLSSIVAVHARAEDYCKLHYEEFDVVTSRAVAKLTTLLEYSIPLVKKDGYFIPMKANCEEEIKDAKKLLFRKNSRIVQVEQFDLPNNAGYRTIIKIKKEKGKLDNDMSLKQKNKK